MFNDQLFPLQAYPPRLFPNGIGLLVHRYSQILKYVQRVLTDSGLFGFVRTPIVLRDRDQPYPIAGGPCAYVIPEESITIDSQHMGDGRHFYGFYGFFTVRVMDMSMKDYTYNDTIRLTDATTGLFRTTHKVINILDLEFASDRITPESPANLFPELMFPNNVYPSNLFPEAQSYDLEISQEPIVLISQENVEVYSRAGNYAAVDLRFRFPYSVHFNRDEEFDDPTGPEPIPSNMADLLLAVKSKVLKQGFMNDFQAIVSLTQDPFPLVGGPFCVITPGRWVASEGDKYGAGRNYAIMEGEFTISPVVQNITDISGYADYAISGDSSNISLYSCVQYLIQQLCLSFLHDPDGNFVATVPLDLVRIGLPRYYRGAGNYVTLPLTFRTKYQEALT